ncbi:MAG TPA: GSCFA domain-containing protein [Saprospiraceae bacterium]|nr:GSCFA domain-containing protein [Saprospiraceae bacterium]
MKTADQLITKVQVPDFHPKIRYPDPIMMAGSCFTEHISNKLERYKYDIVSNPFGILYNPTSLAVSFDRIARLQFYDSDELVFQDGLYHSMDHHGSFSGKDKDAVLEKINRTLQHAHEHLKKSKVVCISPGTSKVYRYAVTSAIAGNCHKIPQAAFSYEQLTMHQCEEAFEKIYSSLQQLAPAAKIIWTVSPVRHLKDGLVENQRSKATLILAISNIIQNHPGSDYFPAYEIMMDELRDYRYYARDLLHPSPVAVDIIWDAFCDGYLDTQDLAYHAPIEKIKRAMEHRFLHNDQEAIRTFAKAQLNNVDQLAQLLPDLNWQKERLHFFEFLDID